MFIPEPEIEFDIRSIIADQVPTEKPIRQTRIDNLDSLPARFDLARGSTSACV
jgi:chromosome partitioning protein